VAVIVKAADLGRPSVVEGAAVLSGPTGPYRAVGGFRQFNFVPQNKPGTAVIVAPSRSHGAEGRLIVNVICP
jgi:hypothetical protein